MTSILKGAVERGTAKKLEIFKCSFRQEKQVLQMIIMMLGLLDFHLI